MTMKRHWWGAGLALGAIFGAACSIEELDEAEAAADDEVVEFRDFTGITDEVCPAWRQVVRRPDGNCPNIPSFDPGESWTGQKMLADVAPGEFGKYCVYQHSNDSPSQNAVDDFQGMAAFSSVAADCLVVQPEGDLVEELNPALRDLTIDRLDRVGPGEINLPWSAGTREPVHVTAVDTTPLSPPPAPLSDHGLAVADLIRNMAHGCDPTVAGCPVPVMNVLGLPRYGFGRNDRSLVNGGYAGFQSEAARGLYAAMRNWELSQTSSYRPKLVVNLSLGWLPDFGGGSPAVDAFRRVLERLNCRGALVIAAAGNDRDDCIDGPMLPAAWEVEAAPDTDVACAAVGVGVANRVDSPADYKPLVHSVGGVDFDDEPIAPSRDFGRPRLAALGESVVGPDETRGPLTGTSMSAAAVSGIAALVWSYNDSLTSHEIAEILWSSGVSTGDTADYALCADAPCEEPEIHRVTACRALEAACDLTSQCPLGFNLDCRDTTLPTTALETAVAGVPVDPGFGAHFEVEMNAECEGYCGVMHDRWNAQGEPNTCEVLEGWERTDYLTTPQPDDPACTACTWVTTNTGTPSQETTILAQLTDEYSGGEVTNVTVWFRLAEGPQPDPFFLGAADLTATEVTRLTIEAPGPVGEIASGRIELSMMSPDGLTRRVNGDPMVRGTSF